ncbi:MAG TPA: hypothetical protein VFX35_09270 [Solirubrobacterales bacterium]|nr:hypothetical protein [Solirubrobacterales bacterium]
MAPPSQYPQTIELPYRWGEIEGFVRVDLRENDDPARLGCPELARGFPTCRATVEPLGNGYADLFGWIQLLDLKNFTRSELMQHSGQGFEVDPYLPIGSATYPFTYFGLAPTLFDAPHTDEDWEFMAHSFLCGLGGELHEVRREARAILGFSWGFSKRAADFEFFGPTPLGSADWDRHHDYLDRAYPGWTFAPGFHDHPMRP